MSTPQLKNYLKFKKNADLETYKELQALKEEIRREIGVFKRALEAKVSTMVKAEAAKIEAKPVELSTFRVAEQVSKTIMGDYKGTKGDKGEQGERGERGEQGLQGIQGIAGRDGERGKQGEQGIQGISGIDGKDGKDGKDANPKSIIKELKKYLKIFLTEELQKMKLELQRFGGGKQIGGGGLDARKIIKDELVGTGDGATVDFTLDYTPNSLSSNVAITVGTARLHITEDFTRSDKTITFLTAPPNGYKIYADYIRT